MHTITGLHQIIGVKSIIFNTEYYVSSTGLDSPLRDGTSASPWATVTYALSRVGGGNTIVVKAGIYDSFEITSNFSGTAGKSTIIRSETKWLAKICGAANYGISVQAGCNHITIDGFEIMGAIYHGVELKGADNIIRNCWIHDNAQQGINSQGYNNEIIENNLVEFNGSHPMYHHGVCAYGDNLIVRNNVVRHNAGCGMQFDISLSNSLIEKNLIYSNQGYYQSGIFVYCPVGGGNNVIVNNTIVDNLTGLTISNGDGEIIANNVFSSNTTQFSVGVNCVVVNNLLYNPATSFGTGGVYTDPKFVRDFRGAYWIQVSSPAIGAGNALYLPDTDFWGNNYSGSPYIGAFYYRAELVPIEYCTVTLDLQEGDIYGYAPANPGSLNLPNYWYPN